uniref:Uncharacterized protein n=1 Tax=Candidatus Kentrum sp. LFY TaxID=2126342 RepID=A0A450U7D0_9GAMM|nr:MAG: hypothetical protein BECKLFY1418B_GA0070995_100749 [Candidatus Kentron sp. LFY]VFJ93547.1 MAG: hypothetical protein BECKLFY1418A_GA0070994_103232 [Candidatus Kentron sp. LFY]
MSSVAPRAEIMETKGCLGLSTEYRDRGILLGWRLIFLPTDPSRGLEVGKVWVFGVDRESSEPEPYPGEASLRTDEA